MDQTGHFPLKRDWALAELNHRYVKDIIIAVYVIYLLKWLASYKWATFKPQRWQNGYFIGLVLISTKFHWDFKITIRACLPMGHDSGHDT